MEDNFVTVDYYDQAFNGPEDNDDQQCSTSVIQVITMDSLLAAEKKILQRVMDLLWVKEYQARALLIKHHWNFDRLMDVYADEGPNKLFTEAGVFIAPERKLDLNRSSQLKEQSALTCNICFHHISSNKVITMDCGHFFCSTCWTKYFKVKIEEGKSKQITCMAEKCNVVCGEEMVRKLVKAKYPQLAARFDRHVLASFVEDNKAIKWCPSVPHCGNAIRVDGVSACEVVEVECSCGHQFCFNCLSEAHSLCTCEMWSRWSAEIDVNKTSIGWIKKNTKPCPRCYKRIIRIDGCNSMICTCGQYFCWACGKADAHHIYKCTPYDDKEATNRAITELKGREEQEKNGSSYEMSEYYSFIHFSRRYIEHKKSLKLEAALKEKVKKRIATAEDGRDTLKTTNDFFWLTNGLQMLFRCRKALCYTYPFTHYMFGNMYEGKALESKSLKKVRFEDLQEQFQLYVERLSELVELPIQKLDEETLMDRRMEVITLTTLANNMCEKLYKFIENELFGSLPDPHNYYIAPYKCVVERASKLH